MDDDTVPASEPLPTPHRHWYRLALAATLLMVVVVIALLPTAVTSMQEVLGRGPDTLYDLVTGQPVDRAAEIAAEDDAIYINLGLIGLDEDTGLLTIAVSGNRHCPGPCPTTTLTLVALDDDADQRRGLPPTASPHAATGGYHLQPVRATSGARPAQPLSVRHLHDLAWHQRRHHGRRWHGGGVDSRDPERAGVDPAEPHRGPGGCCHRWRSIPRTRTRRRTRLPS